MRAEIQNIVTEIEKSLELLGQRLDVETCAYRLEEFDARVEDPNLWDDPDAAQKLMRERQNLVDSIGTYEGIKTDLNDNIELIDLGEMEEDQEVIGEAEAPFSLKILRQKKASTKSDRTYNKVTAQLLEVVG